jgi:hypothetical protein
MRQKKMEKGESVIGFQCRREEQREREREREVVVRVSSNAGDEYVIGPEFTGSAAVQGRARPRSQIKCAMSC